MGIAKSFANVFDKGKEDGPIQLVMSDAKATLSEPECLINILHSVRACQAVLAEPFENRGRIQDRAIYWAVARVKFSLEALANLIEIKLKM